MAEVSRRQAQAVAPLFVAASVLLLALLAFNLRNLNPGAEAPPPAPVREPPPGAIVPGEWGGVLRSFYLATVLALVGIVVIGSFWLNRRGGKLRELVSVVELLGYFLATTFLVLVFLYYDTIFEGLRSFFGWIGVLGGSGEPGGGAGSGPAGGGARRRPPSRAARGCEADALRGMGVSQESIDDLTSLFEEARYSAHAIGERQRDGAIECLGTIRGQREGAAWAGGGAGRPGGWAGPCSGGAG